MSPTERPHLSFPEVKAMGPAAITLLVILGIVLLLVFWLIAVYNASGQP